MLNFIFHNTEVASVPGGDYIILAIVDEMAAPTLWLQLPSRIRQFLVIHW
jgi:hypothetical protein